MERSIATAPPWAPEYRHIVFSETIPRRRAPRMVETLPDSPQEQASDALSEDEEAFLRFVLHEGGLCLGNYRAGTLRRRIPACLRAVRAGNFIEARRKVQSHPAMLEVALSALIIGVTCFFRDESVFETLGRQILPELGMRAGVCAWCAGCSEGHELYSLAMTLDGAGMLEGSRLLGTDCRADAIARARAGLYDCAAMSCVPDATLARYFMREGSYYRVRRELADRTQWRRADVLSLQEPGAWDLILCRNLAMYLCADTARRLWARLEASLRPGGVLVVGKAERPTGSRSLTMIAPCIYRRNRG